MAERIGRRISKVVDGQAVEFALSEEWSGSSPAGRVFVEPAAVPAVSEPDVTPLLDEERSPEFLELAVPKLPVLSKANRARLLMQSPNRLYFYWSVGRNPFHTLSRALGHPGGYMLVLKLVNINTGDEELHRADESGNWWFDVQSDGSYRAEIGFYAVNRPYIRILYSNVVNTPRKSPSPRPADSAEWRVPAERFAKVLDASGFERDAFDVALAGDDLDAAEIATRSAFAQFTGRPYTAFLTVAADELRYAMLALASGASLGELRGLFSERLFKLLSAISELSAANAMAALKERFEVDAEEFEIEEDAAEAVFGASAVNFPRRRRRPGKGRGAVPISSFSLRP